MELLHWGPLAQVITKGGTTVNQEIMPAYAAYQKAIDLTLYHAFAELVVQTSQDDKARMHYRQIEGAQIWQQDVDVSIYFEQYSLRYPGEVLERFEEKLGTDIRIVRALALALAVTRTLHADQMFVGSQRSGFLQKIRRIADGDVYLSGALYHLEEDTVRQRALLDALAKTEYTKTEEALFVLSLFDDREEGYQVMHAQLLRLFGPERTMPLAFNCGVLEWFIRTYAEQVKACRSKADLVLRTLVKLPCMNMKQDSREFAVLTAAGYGADEIILTNSLAMWMDRISYRLSSNSIPAEKLAAACCKMLLNCPEALPDSLYGYVGWLFTRYKDFSIKYEGNRDLWAAVNSSLSPSSPKTILWMNRNIKQSFNYRFDVFDPQYDCLAVELKRDTYLELFTMQMLRSLGSATTGQWLARYKQLTGADYMEYFTCFRQHTEEAFTLLVETKKIDLWAFFEKHRAEGEYAYPLKLLRDYALRISSWKCYRFVEKLLNQYRFTQLQEIFGDRFYFHRSFCENTGGYGNENFRTIIARPFLGPEEHRKLYEWVDSSFFQMEPEHYTAFVWSALKDPTIQRLYDRPTLASVLRQLIARGNSGGYDGNCLKKRFYSKKELEADRKAAAEKKEQEQMLQKQQEFLKRKEKLEQIYNGSAMSLVQFADKYYYKEDKQQAMNMVYEKLLEWPAGCVQELTPIDTQNFFVLCGMLAKYETRPKQELLDMVKNMIEGGAAA